MPGTVRKGGAGLGVVGHGRAWIGLERIGRVRSKTTTFAVDRLGGVRKGEERIGEERCGQVGYKTTTNGQVRRG